MFFVAKAWRQNDIRLDARPDLRGSTIRQNGAGMLEAHAQCLPCIIDGAMVVGACQPDLKAQKDH